MVTSCNIRVQSACGQWEPYYTAFHLVRLSANEVICNFMGSMTAQHHGWQMVAQMLTEKVFNGIERQAVFTFDHHGEETNLIVEAN